MAPKMDQRKCKREQSHHDIGENTSGNGRNKRCRVFHSIGAGRRRILQLPYPEMEINGISTRIDNELLLQSEKKAPCRHINNHMYNRGADALYSAPEHTPSPQRHIA